MLATARPSCILCRDDASYLVQCKYLNTYSVAATRHLFAIAISYNVLVFFSDEMPVINADYADDV